MGGVEGDRSVREVYEGLLVMAVSEHVVCKLKNELFDELIEMMGKTGYRKDRKKEVVEVVD